EWQPITVKDGKLTIAGQPAVQVGPHIFQRKERAVPTAVFTSVDGRTLQLSPFSAMRRVPMAEIVVKAGVGIGYAVALLVALIFLLVWLPSQFMGRLKSRGGFAPRLAPTITVFSIAGFFVMLFLAVSGSSYADLVATGTISPTSVTIYLLSIVYPAFGVGS